MKSGDDPCRRIWYGGVTIIDNGICGPVAGNRTGSR
jgi:hypothetical protein